LFLSVLLPFHPLMVCIDSAIVDQRSFIAK